MVPQEVSVNGTALINDVNVSDRNVTGMLVRPLLVNAKDDVSNQSKK
jgi:hypothetical protein